MSLEKVWVPYLGKEITYYGNLDTLITTNSLDKYPLYHGDKFNGEITKITKASNEHIINTSTGPVRLKYKSAPHMVFSLWNNSTQVAISTPYLRGIQIPLQAMVEILLRIIF